MTPKVRAALVFARRLRISGQRSIEARVILVLADAVFTLLALVARLRRDRTGWRQVAIASIGKLSLTGKCEKSEK